MASSEHNRNIVLVHGSFHTGECWYRLRPVLEGEGMTVATPTLRGQRGNPMPPLRVTLAGYIDDVVAAAESLGGPSILLGHSLAGFAISGAAQQRPDLFTDLIYLNATVPKLGRSTILDSLPSGRNKSPRTRIGLASTFPQDRAADYFYNCSDADVQAEAARLLSPQPFRPMLGAVRSTAERLGALDKHYIEGAEDRVLSLAGQRKVQSNQRFASVHTLATDHSPFLSDPEGLAQAINAATLHL